MSSYSNSRNKQKPSSRGTKTRSSAVTKYGSNPQNSRDLGVLNDPFLTQIICQMFIGRVVEVSTVDEDIHGVFSAISPSGDVAISKSKNGLPSDDMKVLPSSTIKRVVSKDCDDNLIKNKFETDAEIADHVSISRAKIEKDFVFEPYFNNADKLDVHEDSLEKEKDGLHWFPPENMFEVNQKQFNVASSYDNALSSYTIPLDTTLPDYAERSARAEKLAFEIEQTTHSRFAADLENDDGGLDDEDEERKHSAVIRPSNQQSVNATAMGRGRYQSNSRAEALKAASVPDKQQRNSFGRFPGNHRGDSKKYHPDRTSNYSADNEKLKEKVRPLERSVSQKSQPMDSDSNENSESFSLPERQDSKTPDLMSSEFSMPVGKTDEDSRIPQSPELYDSRSDNNDMQKKTSLNPDAPEFKPSLPRPVDLPQSHTPLTPTPIIAFSNHNQIMPVSVSYAASGGPYAMPHPAYSYPMSSFPNMRQVPSGPTVAASNGSKMIRSQISNVPQAANNQAHPPSIPSPLQAKYTLQRSGDVSVTQQQLVGPSVMMVSSNQLSNYPQYYQIQAHNVPQFMHPKSAQPSQHQPSTSVSSSQNMYQNQTSQAQQGQQQIVQQPQGHMNPQQQMIIIPGYQPIMPLIQQIPNQSQAVHPQNPNVLQVQGHSGVSSNSQSASLIYHQPIPFCTNSASMSSHAMHPGTAVSSMPNPLHSQYYQFPCQLTQNTQMQMPVRSAPMMHQQQAHPMPNAATNVNFNHSQGAPSVPYMTRPHNQHPNS